MQQEARYTYMTLLMRMRVVVVEITGRVSQGSCQYVTFGQVARLIRNTSDVASWGETESKTATGVLGSSAAENLCKRPIVSG